ncbi:MAG TPA: AfsA-related hotdog domain-containing protein [Polyangiaceae bacterium]|nr:AfsA-related hotdog domain-containing protein [Polyangiaceae bacterium]
MTVALLDRQWVHKRIDANVFVGEPVRAGTDDFATESFFPINHEFYNDCLSGLSASGYLIEVARQVNLAISHRYFEVPLSAGFLVTSIDWRFNDDAPYVVSDLSSFTLLTHVAHVTQRKGAVCKLETRSRFVQGEREFLSGGAAFLISSRSLTSEGDSAHLELQRSGRAAATADDAQVRDPRNVLIEVPEDADRKIGRIPMLVDPNHDFFFEHENGHVPGMMLLEAGKQAAVYAANSAFPVVAGMYGDLAAGEIRFGRFADLGRTVWMKCRFSALEETRAGYRAAVEISFEQAEREIGRIGGVVSFLDRREVLESSALLRRPNEAPPSARAAGSNARTPL